MTKKRKPQRSNQQTTEQNFNLSRLLPYVIIPLAVIVVFAVIAISNSGDDSDTESADTADSAAEVAVNTAPEDDASDSAPAMVSSPQRINASQYETDFGLRSDNHLLLDVRTPAEFNEGYIPGAVNINVQELSSRLDEIPNDQPIVLYCRSGNRSAQAAQILDQAGYTGVYDLGGIINWPGEVIR